MLDITIYPSTMTKLYLVIISIVIGLASCQEAQDIDIVCCEDELLGCYSNDFPYEKFPLPACNVDPNYHLFTRHNEKDEVILGRTGIPEQFDPSLRTVFIVHGYLNDITQGWSKTMRKRFLDVEDINVVIVGWGGGSDSWLWNYDKSASNTRVVARETALIVENLINNGGSTYDKMWCVGHSLGSHVCGILGMETPLGRVTGLDPAGPEWDDHDVMAGVNPTSADFVDIIHTDGKSLIYPYGTMTPRGHMDFYPNGGETQPGCITYYGGEAGIENIDDNLVSCSHHRAIHYFTESIGNDCFESCRVCEDQFNIPKDCEQCEGCTIMGYGAQGSGPDGIYTLHTSTGWFWSPFCEKC